MKSEGIKECNDGLFLIVDLNIEISLHTIYVPTILSISNGSVFF